MVLYVLSAFSRGGASNFIQVTANLAPRRFSGPRNVILHPLVHGDYDV
jgi:hypothetical protein